jgi:hypothetical protein
MFGYNIFQNVLGLTINDTGFKPLLNLGSEPRALVNRDILITSHKITKIVARIAESPFGNPAVDPAFEGGRNGNIDLCHKAFLQIRANLSRRFSCQLDTTLRASTTDHGVRLPVRPVSNAHREMLAAQMEPGDVVVTKRL